LLNIGYSVTCKIATVFKAGGDASRYAGGDSF
jgi:hypothetical protein